MEYVIVERIPTEDEYIILRQSVGWRILDKKSIGIGLKNSSFGVCAEIGGQVVGMARVVGDRRTCFYIQDVIETGIPGQRHWQSDNE
jgi:hypothetical protein